MIARNQSNRRNLTDFCKVRIELQLKDLYLEKNRLIANKGRSKGGENSNIYFNNSALISGHTPTTQEIPERNYSGNTDRLIAENTGTSHDTAHKAK